MSTTSTVFNNYVHVKQRLISTEQDQSNIKTSTSFYDLSGGGGVDYRFSYSINLICKIQEQNGLVSTTVADTLGLMVIP